MLNSNDMLAKAIRWNPQRFAGFAALALQGPEGAAAELDRYATKLGVVGAMIDGTIDGQVRLRPTMLHLCGPRLEREAKEYKEV